MRQARRPVRPTISQLIDEEVDKLDRLAAEARDGIRSAIHYDQLEEQARGVARGLIDAFRKGRP